MDSVEMSSNVECIEDATAEVLLPSELSNGYDVFGEPQVQPRVGDEYQAEIPSLTSESDITLSKRETAESGCNTCREPYTFCGLPIPVMWVREGVDKTKHEKQEFLVGSDKSCASSVKCEEPEDSNEKRGYFLVPGSQYNSWNEKDEANFLLSLYIFGKNLIQVRRFMENKSIGEVMAYYYGHFYGSTKYKRWSTCRKMKSRKCIYGQKIFSGLRQQELITRLSSQLSDECKSKLQEASKSFGEGKTSLEEYVFSLKDIAGLSNLVEAVGIGKGKQDLTGIGLEHPKPTQTAALFPDVPVGKACSSLTAAEIVTFLTGNFRLSKAKSNDLFWEAVWPRLLARGWHSEQPDSGGSRYPLVFLVPGVKKFSKRKLVKGEHFYDSVTDVLHRVGSQPNLLDLEAETTEALANGGGQDWDTEAAGKSDNSSDDEEERHCYLKPRTLSLSGTNPMKYTVVDTSMVVASGDRKACKLRELRCLPPAFSRPLTFRDQGVGECNNNGDVCEEEKMDESNSVGSSSFTRDYTTADLISKSVLKVNVEKRKNNSELQPKRKTKAISKATLSNAGLGKKKRQKVNVEVDASMMMSSRVNPSPEMLSSTTVSPCMENNSELTDQNPKPPPLWSMIDLNLPVCPDAEFSGQGVAAAAAADSQLAKQASNSEEQQPNRRQSTRNRPLTTKALEAFAFGLFDTKKKRKNSEDEMMVMKMKMARPPKCSRKLLQQSEESYSANFVDLTAEGKGCGESGDGNREETNVCSDEVNV